MKIPGAGAAPKQAGSETLQTSSLVLVTKSVAWFRRPKLVAWFPCPNQYRTKPGFGAQTSNLVLAPKPVADKSSRCSIVWRGFSPRLCLDKMSVMAIGHASINCQRTEVGIQDDKRVTFSIITDESVSPPSSFIHCVPVHTTQYLHVHCSWKEKIIECHFAQLSSTS